MALKKLKSEEQMKEFESEAMMLSSLMHPNVVQFFGIYQDHNNNKYLVTELLTKGDVRSLLVSNDISLELVDLLSMAKDTTAGMAYLHQQNVLHRDLSLSKNKMIIHIIYKFLRNFKEIYLRQLGML